MKSLTVSDNDLRLDTAARRRLFEIGMVGASNGMKFEAFLLFGKLALAEPTESYPLVGVAYCKIMSGQFQHAFQLLSHPIVQRSELGGFAEGLKVLGLHLSGQGFACVPLDDSLLPPSVREVISAARATA